MNQIHLREELSKIGKHSIFVINESHRLLGKGQIWEQAVKINKIAHDLHKELDDSPFRHCVSTNILNEDSWEI
tara:strand:- start:4873 stop:5091 length:219 start_codon:yes stop_codon:yes gene_type:complete